MAKNTSETSNDQTNIRPTAARSLLTKAAPASLVVVTKGFTLVVVLAGYYVLAFFSAVQVVPMTMNFVKSGTGVTLDMPLETVLSFWIVPALFLVALVFVLVLVAMRALWRLRARVVAAVTRWALGQEAGLKTSSAPHTSPLGAKNTHKTSTSAA